MIFIFKKKNYIFYGKYNKLFLNFYFHTQIRYVKLISNNIRCTTMIDKYINKELTFLNILYQFLIFVKISN